MHDLINQIKKLLHQLVEKDVVDETSTIQM